LCLVVGQVCKEKKRITINAGMEQRGHNGRRISGWVNGGAEKLL
jgi:hypothetical protein